MTDIPYTELGKTQPKKKLKRKESSFVIKGDKIYEQILNSKNESKFVFLNNNGVKFLDNVGRIYPIKGEALKKGAILLPEKPENYESVETLIKNISNHIKKYLDVSDDFRTFSTYYILLSWLYDKTNTVCFLRALGDTGTGKSRFLNVIGRLLYKPCIVSGAVTPAPIYRIVEIWKGSLVIDEADFKDSTEKNEVVTILNCRFERGRPVLRCDKENPNDIQVFEVFGPTVIATRKSFRDKALESRCLTEVMKETRRKDILPVLDDEFYKEERLLRNKLLRFRMDYYNKINYNAKIDFDFGEIEPRLKQATSSFVVLFANIPEIAERFKKFLLKYNQDLVLERSNTFEGMIVNTILSMFLEGGDILISDLTERINNEYKINTTGRSVGRYLKQLGLSSLVRKIEGKSARVVEINREFFGNLVERYVPKDSDIYGDFWSKKVTTVTLVTSHIGERGENNNKKKTDRTDRPQKPIGYNKEGLPHTNVTNVTNVTQKLQTLPTDSDFHFDILKNTGWTEKMIEYAKNMGLIFEVKPKWFRKS